MDVNNRLKILWLFDDPKQTILIKSMGNKIIDIHK